MKKLFFGVLILAGACAGPRGGVGPDAVYTTPRRRPPPPEVKDPNFILAVSEVVDESSASATFTKVFVDGHEAGATEAGPPAVPRELKLKLIPGNEPVRLEQWILPPSGDWAKLDDERQPRERFVRVKDGMIARLSLRFAIHEASNVVSLIHEPAP